MAVNFAAYLGNAMQNANVAGKLQLNNKHLHLPSLSCLMAALVRIKIDLKMSGRAYVNLDLVSHQHCRMSTYCSVTVVP